MYYVIIYQMWIEAIATLSDPRMYRGYSNG